MSVEIQSPRPKPKIIYLKKGLDIKIQGEPSRVIHEAPKIETIAVLGNDYVDMKPSFAVKAGDYVKKGQLLFTDRKMPRVRYTSPGSGKIIAINKGLRRVFQSLVIQLDYKFEERFKFYSENKLSALTREQVEALLLESGEWISLRQRPYGRTANPEIIPNSIFINCVDTNPLAPSIKKILINQEKDLLNGLKIIAKLTEGKTFFIKAPNLKISDEIKEIAEVVSFEGPHPAGNVGTHIHFLDPVHKDKAVWFINFQDLIAIGKLFITGRAHYDRIISLAGPSIAEPKLIETRLGASVLQMTANELTYQPTEGSIEEEIRLISGSVLWGHIASGPFAYLGRYHQQICAFPEGTKRDFLGWMSPGWNKFSIKPAFFSKLNLGKKFKFTTSMNGSPRAMVPIGMYEKVMPLDILPTFLLRALLSYDVEKAEELGCLELDEEDLSLCSFVSPGKEEFGPLLRKILLHIENEG